MLRQGVRLIRKRHDTRARLNNTVLVVCNRCHQSSILPFSRVSRFIDGCFQNIKVTIAAYNAAGTTQYTRQSDSYIITTSNHQADAAESGSECTRDNSGEWKHEHNSSSSWQVCAFGAAGLISLIAALHGETFDVHKGKFRTLFDKILPTAYCASPVGPGGDARNLRSQYNFIADVVEKVSPAVVHIKASSYFRQGAGSGFIISSDGLIVTNEHVVRHARNGQVQVDLGDGRTFIGVVQVVDSNSDLALVKINESNLPFMRLGNSSSLRPGEWVIAMGSPLALSNTVTSGIVSSKARKSKELGIMNEIDYIQTDAAITFGNSGGPLINLDGDAVGVNSMKVTEGISFAIPSDYVKKFLLRADEFKKNMEAKKKSSPSYIGVSALTLTPYLAAQLRNRTDISELEVDHGVFIVRVTPDSPSDQAGLQRYDVILRCDGKDVNSVEDLHRALGNKADVRCIINRSGSIREVNIRPQSVQ